jgi:sugar/nucleoside kinase (ribokinase family)
MITVRPVTEQLDLTGIGNAIVDVISHADDSFLESEGLTKGAMQLLDEDGARALYEKMDAGIEVSGGSAGNTMAGFASLGGAGGYIGKIRNDALGEIFAHDIRAAGVHFDTQPSTEGASTARCLILVTPDAQRTMNTFLGACVELGPDDIDPDLIKRSKVTYLEGYLYDRLQAKQAFIKAATIAHDAGRKVSLTLSDSFCVDRHREAFQDLVDNHIDVLFANEAEILSLYETDSFEAAVSAVRSECELAALTRGSKGSTIITPDQVIDIPAEPVERLVDTTGAGDLFAAGFLYGYTRNMSFADSGRLGSIAAGEIISHYGARPETSLAELMASKMG